MMADLAKIKRNVAKMAAQNASEADIDGYIASEGVTVDDVRNFKSQAAPEMPTSDPRDNLLGKVDTAVRGAADALTLGTADEIAAAVRSGSLFGLNSGLWGDYQKALAEERGIDAADAENRFGYRLGGQIAGGVTGGVGLARAGLSPTANAINAGWRLPAVALTSGLEGAAFGAAHGLGSGEGAEDRFDQAKAGAAWGLGGGAVAPVAVSGVSSLARKAITPFRAAPERAAAAAVLEREGVPLTAGQRVGSDPLRYAEGEIGGRHAAEIMEQQKKAFTDAIMRRAGASGLADSDNLSALNARIGAGFDDITSRNSIIPDQELADDIANTVREYARVLPANQKEIFANMTGDVIDRFSGGNVMDGATYQGIRSRLTKMARSSKDDTQYAEALRGLRNSLDGAFKRNISPDDADAWDALNRQYGNMKVIENAALGAGEDAATGIISPARLRMADVGRNRTNYARGNTDFSELARAGQTMMTPLPNSGTASRLAVRGLMSFPAAAGAIAGGSTGDILTGLGAAAAGAALPRAVGRAMMSKAEIGRAHV